MLGFKTSNQKALAELRVKRGVRWLNLNAPHRWQFHLLDLRENGNISFRARPLYTSGHDSILGLVFEDFEEFVLRGTRYTTDSTVMRKYKLSHQDVILLGFVADYRNDATEYERSREFAMHSHLQTAWLEAIKGYAKPGHTPNMHDGMRARVDRMLKDQLGTPRHFVGFNPLARRLWVRPDGRIA